MEGVSSVERSQKVQPMMNHARKEIGVEAIDYLKSINAPFGKNFDGRGMVISNISILEQIIGIRLWGSMMMPKTQWNLKEDLKGTDKNYWLSDKIPHAFNYYNGGKITVKNMMMVGIILTHMGCILQGFLLEMILKKISRTLMA